MSKEVLDAIKDLKANGYDVPLSKIASYVRLAKKEKDSELAYELCCLPDAIKEIEAAEFAKKWEKNPNQQVSKRSIRNELAKVVYTVGDPKWVYTFANEFQLYVNIPKFLKKIIEKGDAFYAAEFDRDILSADLNKYEKQRQQVFDLVYSKKDSTLARKYLTENDYTDKQKLKLFSIIGRETRQKMAEEKKKTTMLSANIEKEQ